MVVKAFKEREEKAIQMIIDSGIKFIELGIFGSYARNEYTALSDIDIMAIVEERPPGCVSGGLREDLDMMDVQLVYSSPEYFNNSNSLFARSVREDYIKIFDYKDIKEV